MNLKAYDSTWSQQEAMRAAAKRWHRRGLLSAAQRQAIEAAYPLNFYRPGLFLRLVLFIFAGVSAFGAAGLLVLILDSGYFRVLAFLCAIGSLALLEVLLRSSRLYHAGVDNALLYSFLGWTSALLADIIMAQDFIPLDDRYDGSLVNPYMALVLIPVLVLFVVAAIRYADRLVAAAAYLTALLLIINLLSQVSYGRLLLPFVLMLASVGAYQLVRHLTRRPDYLYYKPCLTLLQALTLATFYLGGSYYVVREGNAALNGEHVSGQIAFAPIFYLFTAFIPLVYIANALRRPDRVWLLTGLLAAAFSLFTLLYYRAVLPPELAAVLAGAVLLGWAAWATRYLRPARHGFTSLPDDEQSPHFNLEALVVAETAAALQAPTPGFGFGGGHSGDGGADGSY